ncbi:hypothetical protein GCM10007874_47140 [Labrys miyagiensis]|uniref:Uncharacterized protein n=1 Tax=Labrys miyagiensis TaxID=346912 RepID=A0ABQ6CQ16_9HYPH|nr:hypothetical protein [Labrys miyagiensis]GLS21697.1 hypothetical protein GCM10007874_47140 [Labrys miyagiensis]
MTLIAPNAPTNFHRIDRPSQLLNRDKVITYCILSLRSYYVCGDRPTLCRGAQRTRAYDRPAAVLANAIASEREIDVLFPVGGEEGRIDANALRDLVRRIAAALQQSRHAARRTQEASLASHFDTEPAAENGSLEKNIGAFAHRESFVEVAASRVRQEPCQALRTSPFS